MKNLSAAEKSSHSEVGTPQEGHVKFLEVAEADTITKSTTIEEALTSETTTDNITEVISKTTKSEVKVASEVIEVEETSVETIKAEVAIEAALEKEKIDTEVVKAKEAVE